MAVASSGRPAVVAPPGCCPPVVSDRCAPPSSPSDFFRQGHLPVVFSVCDNARVIKAGRAEYASIPDYAARHFFAEGALRAPRQPLTGSAVGAGAQAQVALAADAASGATTQRNRHLIAGFVLEYAWGDDAPLPKRTISVDGFFEDDSALSHTGIQVAILGGNSATIVIIPTKELDGKAYPALALIQNDFKVVLGGTSIALTAAAAPNDATAIVPTSGIQFPDRTATITDANLPTGATLTVDTLAPTTQYYNAMIEAFSRSLGGGQ
jgi:hypothetical protein